MDVSLGGCCEQNKAFIRERKRGKVAVGPGSGERKAGFETNNCGELRVGWRGLCAFREGGGRTWAC